MSVLAVCIVAVLVILFVMFPPNDPDNHKVRFA